MIGELVSVSELLVFIANVLVIGILVILHIGVPPQFCDRSSM